MKRAVLQTIAVVDVVAVVALNLIGCVGTIAANGWAVGLSNIASWYSPFNIANLFLNVVLLSPALICYWLMNKQNSRT
jgi:hypothetical protein